MKIEKITLKFKPPFVSLYAVISTQLCKCQLQTVLTQLSQKVIGSGPLCKNPLNMKQKIFIQPVPIRCANKNGAFIMYAECAKSKVQKIIGLLNAADQDAPLKVDTVYIVSGPMDLKLESGAVEKGLKFIIPSACYCGQCSEKTEIKCKDQKELIATVGYYNGCFKVEVSGLNVIVYGKVKSLASSKVERMFKKAEDSLKGDFSTAKKIISLSCGLL